MAILARSMAVMRTKQSIIALAQPWLVKRKIRDLNSCGKILYANDKGKLRICVVANGEEASLLTEFSNGGLTVVLMRINRTNGRKKDLVVGSIYMPYDSAEPPPPRIVD